MYSPPCALLKGERDRNKGIRMERIPFLKAVVLSRVGTAPWGKAVETAKARTEVSPKIVEILVDGYVVGRDWKCLMSRSAHDSPFQ